MSDLDSCCGGDDDDDGDCGKEWFLSSVKGSTERRLRRVGDDGLDEGVGESRAWGWESGSRSAAVEVERTRGSMRWRGVWIMANSDLH
jgi:hypothetical protein